MTIFSKIKSKGSEWMQIICCDWNFVQQKQSADDCRFSQDHLTEQQRKSLAFWKKQKQSPLESIGHCIHLNYRKLLIHTSEQIFEHIENYEIFNIKSHRHDKTWHTQLKNLNNDCVLKMALKLLQFLLGSNVVQLYASSSKMNQIYSTNQLEWQTIHSNCVEVI